MHHATLTLCLATVAGVSLVVAGHRLKVPSIFLLLLGGVVLGPEVLGWLDPASLGSGLETIIALAVAVILFEGGLTLDLAGYRRAPTVIRRMLTVGPLVTWLGTAAAVILILDMRPGIALMAGSLVIVTGPTVISPLLRRMHIRERLHHVLYWEGVLIDIVGVFVAVLCYEWLTPDDVHPLLGPVGRFALRMLAGTGIGFVSGLIFGFALNRRWIPEEHLNIASLAVALGTFGAADSLLTEAGILAVVVSGLVVGRIAAEHLKHVKRFKFQLTELGIGLLFVLLAAKLNLAQFDDWRLVLVLIVLIFVLRPIAVGLSTWGQKFEFKEKVMMSWMAPRGIVAAAMASLFSLRLRELGHPEAAFLETFTYAVIAVTVTVQGLSAQTVARLLGLERKDLLAWIVTGERALVTAIGAGLRKAGVQAIGLDEMDEDYAALDEPQFAEVGAVLRAYTAPPTASTATRCQLEVVPETSCFGWSPPQPEGAEAVIVGASIWRGMLSPAEVAHGLDSGALSIDVFEVGSPDGRALLGPLALPLFWVQDGRATLVPEPNDPGAPAGDLAVVLRRRIEGLANLVSHVEVIDGGQATFESVVKMLVGHAGQSHEQLESAGELAAGILARHGSMSVAIGGGVAIPHAYADGLERSVCFVANVRGGLELKGPDEAPVRLVFLLLSPCGQASTHLAALAAVAQLAEDAGFIDLLARQRVPKRLAGLIANRA